MKCQVIKTSLFFGDKVASGGPLPFERTRDMSRRNDNSVLRAMIDRACTQVVHRGAIPRPVYCYVGSKRKVRHGEA